MNTPFAHNTPDPVAAGQGKGCVAAGHPAVAQVAADILDAGGNAFDAAIAAAFAACVCEPAFASLGGGGMMLARPIEQKPAVFDFFADTPRVREKERPLDWLAYPTANGTPLCGGLASVATPGTIAGLFAIHDDLGWMPMRDLMEQAITLAKGGVPVRPLQAKTLGLIAPLLKSPGGSPEATNRFLKSDGAKQVSLGAEDTLFQPELAAFLDALSLDGPSLFYRGDVAVILIAECAARGGHLTAEDLAHYHVITRTPLSVGYGDTTLETTPLPALSGVQMAHSLALLDGQITRSQGWGSNHHWGLIADAIALTHERVLAAEDSVNGLQVSTLMDAKQRDQDRKALTLPPVVRRGTTHISVADRKGNLAAITLSNGEGSGRVLPGCGILLNNFLGTLDRGPDDKPWWLGRQRLGSLLAPTLMTSKDGTCRIFGAGGASRIRTALLQTIVNMVDFGLAADAAIQKPRLHVLGHGDDAILGAEGDIPQEIRQRWPRHRSGDGLDMFFGGVHLAQWSRTGQMMAAADPRRDGTAILV